METAFDAIIIGAGPAGCCAAILLARAGWRVALVEKHAFPRRKVCGECIAASNLPLLDALGIGKEFSRLAGPALRQLALVCGERMIRAPLPPYPDPAHQWGVALGREHLDAMLALQARRCGAEVFQPWLACSMAGTPGNFQCRIRAVDTREERLLAAPLLIDAHGSWQPLQARDGPQRASPQASDLFAFKANFAGARLEPGLLPLLSFPGGYGGIVMGDHMLTTFAFCLRRDALAQARLQLPGRSAGEAAAGWVMRHCMAVAGMLAGAVQRGKWLGAGPICPGIRISRPYRAAFLAGNAAGEAHPIIGEGISMALQSAVLLANTLARCKADIANRQSQQQLQAQYANAWRAHFAPRMRLATVFAHAAMHPRLLRGLLPALEHNPALLRHFARWSGKVRPGPSVRMGTPTVEY